MPSSSKTAVTRKDSGRRSSTSRPSGSSSSGAVHRTSSSSKPSSSSSAKRTTTTSSSSATRSGTTGTKGPVAAGTVQRTSSMSKPSTSTSSAAKPATGPMAPGVGAQGPNGMNNNGMQGPNNGMGGMNGMGGFGSMNGMNGFGSMNNMNGMNNGMGGMNGMGGFGSMNGGFGSMNNMNGGAGAGPGMDGQGAFGSMNNMNGMNGMNPMGSMYGPTGGMGSMYGMGGMGSMYGMGGMGSMYGMMPPAMMMPMGSMYGGMMPGMMYGILPALSRYNSMGLGSNYGSLYGLGGDLPRLGSQAGSFVRMADYDDTAVKGKRTSTAMFKEGDKKSTADDKKPAAATGNREIRVKPADSDKKDAPASSAATPAPATAARSSASAVRQLTKKIDDKLHAVAIVANASQKADKTVKLAEGSFTMDEVHTEADYALEKSDLLTDLAEHANCGHIVSLIALCGQSSTPLAEKVANSVVEDIMKKLSAAKDAGEKSEVYISSVAFPAGDKVRDLLAPTIPAAGVAATFGSNPIYGPCMMNVTEKKITEPKQASAAISASLAASKPNEMVVTMLQITQLRTGADKKTEAYSLAVLVAFLRDANMKYLNTMRVRGAEPPGRLFNTAIGGASRTVILVPVAAGETGPKAKESCSEGEKLRALSNKTLRSGSLTRFVELTKKALAQQGSDSKVKEKMEVMMKDAQAVIDAPETTRLKCYPLSSK